jgi:membrane protease YdiL (CAAX protease family)
MNEWPLPGELPEPSAPDAAVPVATPEPPFPVWGYGDLLFVLGLFLGLTLAFVVVGFLLFAMYPRLLTIVPPPMAVVLQQAFIYGAGLLALYSVVTLRYGQPFWDALRWQGSAANLKMAVWAGIGTAVAGTLLGAALGAQNLEEMPMQAMLSSKAVVAVVGLLAVTVGPLWEELTFRGFLLPLVAKSFGNVAAIVITAFPFALMHGPQYGWAWQALLPVAFAGVCFGAARVMTSSTSVATLMHSIYNLTVFAGFLAQGGADKLP